jgi:hypothetical protein
MLIGHHQFPFFFSSFLLRRAFRDVKQIFDDCFMFQHISTSRIVFAASTEPEKELRSRQIMQIEFSVAKKLAQEASMA